MQKTSNVTLAAPATPTSSSGTVTYEVTASDDTPANPGVYWYQLDTLKWKAETSFGDEIANNDHSRPAPTTTRQRFDLTDYSPVNGVVFTRDDGGTDTFTKSQLSRMKIVGSDDLAFENQTSSEKTFKGIAITRVDDTHADISVATGYGYKEDYYTKYSGDKYKTRYLTPFNIKWHGEVDKKAELRVVQDMTLTVGATKQLKAQVRTKTGTAAWTSWNDVTAATWTSDKPSAVSVASDGAITAKALGQAEISATWKDADFHLIASATIKVMDSDSISISSPSSRTNCPQIPIQQILKDFI